MKLPIFKVFFACLGLLFLYFVYANISSYKPVKVVATSTSPSKMLTAAVIRLGEGGDVPYGSSIVVYETSNPDGWRTREEVYRGYCESKLSWKSDNELEVRCGESRAPKIQRMDVKGVRISYIVDPRPSSDQRK